MKILAGFIFSLLLIPGIVHAAPAQLPAPLQLKAQLINKNTVKLTWKKPKGTFTGYAIYRSTKSGTLGTRLHQINNKRLDYFDYTRPAGKYYYTVKTYSGSRVSANRNQVAITVPKKVSVAVPPIILPKPVIPPVIFVPPPPDPCLTAPQIALEPATTYVIITRKKFVEDLAPFITNKTNLGERVATFDLEHINCVTAGKDIPDKLRNFLRRTKAETQTRYALLVGAALHEPDITRLNTTPSLPYAATKLTNDWEIPVRYVESDETPPIPTDQYYASLEGTWDTDNDGLYGESLGRAFNEYEFTIRPDILVGRIPVQTNEGLRAWVQKTNAWTPRTAPVHSQFVSQRCISKGYNYNFDGKLQLYPPYNYTHDVRSHYCITDTGGDIANFANQDGADFISTYSHGYYQGIVKSVDYSGRLGTVNAQYGYELNKQSPGFFKAPILFVHGCEVGGFDYTDTSLGEHLIASPQGVTAIVASSRSHWDITFEMWEEVFFHKKYRLGDAFYSYKFRKDSEESVSDKEIKNYMMFNLFGDPSLTLIKPDVELFVPDINFHNRTSTIVQATLQNNTGVAQTGLLSYPNQSVSAGPYSTQSFAVDYYNSFNLPTYHDYITFNGGSQRLSTGASPLFSIGLDLSCGRVEKSDTTWKAYLKAFNELPSSVRLETYYQPGYYFEGTYSANAQPADIFIRSEQLNLSANPTPIITISKPADRDPLPTGNFTGTYNFGLLKFKLFSTTDNSLLSTCNIGS